MRNGQKRQNDAAERELRREAEKVDRLAQRLRPELGEDGYGVLQREVDRLEKLADDAAAGIWR
jgi:hypothetical protein